MPLIAGAVNRMLGDFCSIIVRHSANAFLPFMSSKVVAMLLAHRTSLCARISTVFRLVSVTMLLTAGCDHSWISGPQSATSADEPKTASATLAAEKLELYMEHPYLVQGQPTKFNVHFTVLNDGMPIREGKLVVTATGPTGKTAVVEQAAPRSPGIFGPLVPFPEAGENMMTLALDSPQANETIRVHVMVYADAASAADAAAKSNDVEPEGAIKFLKEQAWKIGVTMQPVTKRPMTERLRVPGEIVPAAGAKAVITPPMEGRVLPPPGGEFPKVGDEVEAGQVVAIIDPPLAGPQGVQLLVNQSQIQALETELAVKEMDVEADINRARIDMEFAQSVYDRLRSLGDQSIAPQRQVEEAQRQLLLAKATYEGKQRLRQPYDEARQKLRATLKPNQPAGGVATNNGSKPEAATAGMGIVLRAPVTGTVTSAHATTGEYVSASKELFTIVNLDHVWMEAKVSEYDLGRISSAPAAEFVLAAYPGHSFSILGEDGGKLIDIGKIVDPASRTVTVQYELPNPNHAFRIGLFAQVGIETGETKEALAIPQEAIVDEDGRPTVYVQANGEAFQKRDLELGIRDGGLVEVKKGLNGNERVVVKGGYAIRLASVSAVIPAHGHTH